MAEKTLNHFLFVKFSDRFWALAPEKQAALFPSLAKELGQAACTYFYQVSPLQAGIDILVWSAIPLENAADEANFFEKQARVLHAHRPLLEPVQTLWGYTKPSLYAKSTSAQEIDPFQNARATYLVAYPFVKTIQWYLMGKDTRQGMMNEHIRIGRQYPEIKQLLLYSFGVQDQEFIVVYETEDLYKFSELVNDLRSSDVREYTERDPPVYTGIWRSPEAMGGLFGARAGER
jgi:chlorite dismutase